MNLKPGDTVTVYHDPVTQTNPEGQAVLRKLVIDDTKDGGGQYWDVHFTDDEYGSVPRWIH